MSKTIYCDSGYTYCQARFISDDFKEACKQLDELGWRKVGYGLDWGWYCPIHAQIQIEKNKKLS